MKQLEIPGTEVSYSQQVTRKARLTLLNLHASATHLMSDMKKVLRSIEEGLDELPESGMDGSCELSKDPNQGDRRMAKRADKECSATAKCAKGQEGNAKKDPTPTTGKGKTSKKKGA